MDLFPLNIRVTEDLTLHRFKDQGQAISDGTFRVRRLELERLGLVEKERVDH